MQSSFHLHAYGIHKMQAITLIFTQIITDQNAKNNIWFHITHVRFQFPPEFKIARYAFMTEKNHAIVYT